MKLDHIYISNKDKVAIEKIFSVEKIGDQNIENINISFNPIYIIDIHCTHKRTDKMQHQGGVTIYRHLLKIFDGKQDNLKVIFYSPIPKKDLVKLKPENYVLNLLPFVELLPEKDKHGNPATDWNFAQALQEEIDEYEKKGWPQFNNASENLLSGWALAGGKKIDLNGKKPLVIDDEWKQWELTYRTILSTPPEYFLSNEPNIKDEYTKLKSETFNHLYKNSLESYDLIISDLYLCENHDTNKWKTEEIINDISGLRLFKKIREIEPAVPVLFHTTSNKFRIFEILSALGTDGQIPKNINPDATKDEKMDTAKLFQEKLETITAEYSNCWLNEFYRFVKNEGFIKDPQLLSLKNNALKLSEFKTILLHSIVSGKDLLNNKISANYYDTVSFNPICLSICGIINQLGKIPEEFKFLQKYAAFNFVSKLRDHASHTNYYNLFEIEDLKLVFAPIFMSLKNQLKESEKFSVPINNLIKDNRKAINFYKHPLLNYLFFYYNSKTLIPSNLESHYQRKISWLLSIYFHEKWMNYGEQHKNTIKNHFSFFKSREPSLTEPKISFENDTVSLTLN